MNCYKSFSEWKKDFDVYQVNPHDKQLEAAINDRMNKSSAEVREEISEFLESLTLETNPAYAFARVMQRVGSDKILITKHPKNPWFEA